MMSVTFARSEYSDQPVVLPSSLFKDLSFKDLLS